MKTAINCVNCGKFISHSRTSKRKYCSAQCAKEYNRNLYMDKNSRGYEHLTSGQMGAVSELLVSAELMKLGYEVFRAVSPSSSCDLVCIKNGETFRVEVRTGKRSDEGKVAVTRGPKDYGRSDILAVLLRPHEVLFYIMHEDLSLEQCWQHNAM